MSHVVGLPKGVSTTLDLSTGFLDGKFFPSFLTRESRACPRASCRYDVENGTRSLDWSIPVNFFSILGF